MTDRPLPTTAGHGLLQPNPSASLPPARRGRLRNGAAPGDFLAAPRCGARTRAGGCCRQPAMRNGRCRLHGGLSTGPRTAEGRARCAAARRTPGFYSAEIVALRRAGTAYCRRMDALLAALKGRRTAGHGVLPSISAGTVSGASVSKINRRGHRGHGVGSNPARVARYSPSSVTSLRSVVNLSSAGHGLHPSFSNAPLSPRARRLLGGTAPLAAFSAGHRVLPSFSAGPLDRPAPSSRRAAG